VTCPICAKESDPKYRPFCSRRCADIDLGRWLNERYVLPAKPADEEESTPDDGLPKRPQ
jgi:endogenous inhibitor of DNA gyrase (YacG/DUF329 family)